MRLMVSTKLNPILLTTIRFTVCGIPTNVYKKYGNLLFPQYTSLFLKPVLTILDRSKFRRLAYMFFFLSVCIQNEKRKLQLPRQIEVAYIKHNFIIIIFQIILNRERRDSRDVKFKKPRHKRYVILFAFQTVHTGTQKSKEVLTNMQQQMFYQQQKAV